MKAQVARFYGFSHSEMGDMLLEDFQTYHGAIQTIQAQEFLDALKVSAYPHCDKNEKIKIHREAYKLAKPDVFGEKKPVVTLEQLSRMLKNGR